MQVLVGILFLVGPLALAIVQLVAGFAGIDYHFGHWWAWAAAIMAIGFRITLPITIACFFGAKDVWGWHWAGALALAAPGLIFMTPAMISAIVESARHRWASK